MKDPIIEAFVAECRSYCQERNISLASLGAYAVNDNSLFVRLEGDGQCLPRTMGKIRRYMAENPPELMRGRRRTNARRHA